MSGSNPSVVMCITTLHIASPHSTSDHYTTHCITTQYIGTPQSTSEHHTTRRITKQHIASPHSTSHHHTAHRITTQHIASPHCITTLRRDQLAIGVTILNLINGLGPRILRSMFYKENMLSVF